MASNDQVQSPVLIVPASQVSTEEFVRRSAQANEFEIQAGQLALERSQSDNVKKYAQAMVDQHTQAKQSLAQMVPSSTDAGKLDKVHLARLEALRSAPQDKFDEQYLSGQVVAHADASAMTQGYAASGDESSLKQVATNMAPVIQDHLNAAWAMSGVPQRLQAARSDEATMLAQNTSGSGTYRGYRVYGEGATRETGTTPPEATPQTSTTPEATPQTSTPPDTSTSPSAPPAGEATPPSGQSPGATQPDTVPPTYPQN